MMALFNAPSDDDASAAATATATAADLVEKAIPYAYLGARLVLALAVVWFTSNASTYVCSFAD
jgi:hypothetical protein